jgi:thioredoxin-like negative regulator of GroEL
MIGQTHGANAIRDVTRHSFDAEILHGRGPIAVEFMSYGCAHCRVIEPVMQEAAAELRASEGVFRVNVGADGELAERYAVAGTPTLIMFFDGREVGRVEGPHPTLPSVMTALTAPFQS